MRRMLGAVASQALRKQMSTTTIYNVILGESVTQIMELRNSHGAAPVIWDVLTERVLKRTAYSWITSGSDDLWPVWEDKSLPLFARAVHAMTFDRVYVERAHFVRAAADIREFLTWAPISVERVNHWPAIAKLFESLVEDESIGAIGFDQTSLGESLWDGEWNEEMEEYDQPDWSEFWSLYPALNAQEA